MLDNALGHWTALSIPGQVVYIEGTLDERSVLSKSRLSTALGNGEADVAIGARLLQRNETPAFVDSHVSLESVVALSRELHVDFCNGGITRLGSM